MIVPEVGLAGSLVLAEELRSLVEKTAFRFEDLSIPVTVSLGVAEWDASMQSGEELIAVADERLYAAKQGGRNRVVGG